jgi:UDP-glucose 4-epimerase
MAKSKTNNSILCIGGNGFLGSHVTDLLLQEDCRVSVLDPFPERFRKPNTHIRNFTGHLTDHKLLDRALEGTDVVIHLLSSVVPSTSEGKTAFDIQSNLLPTVHLMDRMLFHGVKKLVFFSSGGAIYGNPAITPTPETAHPHPVSVYGQGKWVMESYIQFYAQSGLQSLFIRPSNVYGIRQANSGVFGLINTLLDALIQDVPVPIFGGGVAIRDYLHVSDLMTFLQMAIRKDAQGVYNVGSGIGQSVSEVVNLVEKTVGKSLKKEQMPARPFDVDRIVLDITKARTELGWNPKVAMEDGIREMWDFKRRNA